MFGRGVVWLGAAIVAAVFAPGPAAAKFCKDERVVATSKPHATRSLQAFPGSLIAWRRVVRDRYGRAWQLWSRAEDKSVYCKEVASGPKKGKWRCTRSARPCSGPIGVEAVDVCKPHMTVVGAPRSSQAAARVEARVGWQVAVQRDHGERYAFWSEARSRDIVCETKNDTFACTATAQPCRS